jgi:hypothetical protein
VERRNNGNSAIDAAKRAAQALTQSPTPPPVVAPAPKPQRPDSFALKVFRGTTKAEELKFAKDSAARADSLKAKP